MELLIPSIREALLRNGRIRKSAHLNGDPEIDFIPVVKLFMPDAACVWLLTEIDPYQPDIAFGLCDLGVGCPEVGSERIRIIEMLRGERGMPVERDLSFAPRHTLRVYARAAWAAKKITEDEQALRAAAEKLASERSVS
jgi:hypothetical protein